MRCSNAITVICALMIGYQLGTYVQKKRERIRKVVGGIFFGEGASSP